MILTVEYPPTCTNPKQRCRKREYITNMQKSLSNIHPLNGDIYVSAKFYPENYYLHRGDIDNLIKTLLDAIKGRCFYDDSQIRALYAVMMDSAPGKSHVELRIESHHSFTREAKNENYSAQG